MIGNGNFEGAIKKQVTDFTIDCILSKDDQANDRRPTALPQQPMTLNKVLNNNPWIPISPLAHFFTPSAAAIQKKFPLSTNFFGYCPTPIGTNFIQNLIKATEHNNHFYALSSSTTTTTSINLIQKSNYANYPPSPSLEEHINLNNKALPAKTNFVYENLSSDTQILIDKDEQQQRHHLATNSNSPSLSVTSGDGENKCTTCLKFFETNDLLEVSEKIKIKKN